MISCDGTCSGSVLVGLDYRTPHVTFANSTPARRLAHGTPSSPDHPTRQPPAAGIPGIQSRRASERHEHLPGRRRRSARFRFPVSVREAETFAASFARTRPMSGFEQPRAETGRRRTVRGWRLSRRQLRPQTRRSRRSGYSQRIEIQSASTPQTQVPRTQTRIRTFPPPFHTLRDRSEKCLNDFDRILRDGHTVGVIDERRQEQNAANQPDPGGRTVAGVVGHSEWLAELRMSKAECRKKSE